MKLDLSPFIDNCTKDHLFKSEISPLAREKPSILGIDEAGRGPVLGPMVYGLAYYPEELDKEMKNQHFADSKSLSETSREKIFNRIENNAIGNFGWMAQAISPTTISNQMLRRKKYNLNLLSHDAAMMLIQQAIDAGVNVKKVFLDTVGPEKKYEEKLSLRFPRIQFKVSKKADSLYTVVSAASICAKVIRDRIVSEWKFPGDVKISRDYGSGYPADPKTMSFLKRDFDNVFGFSSFIRFSWSTAQDIIEKEAVQCDWPDDDENQTTLKKMGMFKVAADPGTFFTSRNLKRINNLSEISS